MSLFLTAAQTTGPFVAISFERTQIRDVAPPGVNGERVVVQGRILDGDGKAVEDAQAKAGGEQGCGCAPAKTAPAATAATRCCGGTAYA